MWGLTMKKWQEFKRELSENKDFNNHANDILDSVIRVIEGAVESHRHLQNRDESFLAGMQDAARLIGEFKKNMNNIRMGS